MNTLPVTSYTLPPSNSLLPFQINPYSGILTWLPNTIGIYAYRIKITEFRYDTITQTYNTLAIHNKDLGIMSLLIPPSVSFLMAPIPNSTLLPNGAKMVQFKDQQSNDLLLSFTGVSASNFSLNPFGGPFAFDPLQTNIIRNVIDGNSVDYILSWSPSPQYVGNGPYMFVVRITHHGITYDMLMAIQVISSVGISEAEIYRVNMFPNPISGGEFLQIALNGVIGHTGELIISDQSGRVVLAQQIDAGVNQVLIPAHLPRGLYIATIQGEEAVVVEKLMVR
jgi:hypothetical protein